MQLSVSKEMEYKYKHINPIIMLDIAMTSPTILFNETGL